MTKRLGLSLSTSQALWILWLVMAMFLLPTERWISLSISEAIAADSHLARQFGDWDNFFEPCISAIKSTETLYRPHGPIPEPGPLVIGCRLADCGPGADGPGPIDLRITLTGDLAEGTLLEFENMTVRDAEHIGVRGNARHVKGTTKFEVRSGTTVLRGFRTNPELRPPVAIPYLTLNHEALEALKQAAKNDDLLANSKSPVTFDIEQFRGRVNVNRYAVRYEFRICPTPRPPLPPPTPDRVEFSNGIPPDRVLILAPGRLGTGPWGCAGYEDEVYESSAKAVVPVNNHLADEGSLISFRNGEERFIWSLCHSEVVVYGKSNALFVAQPVTPPWTDPVGDKVPVALRNPLMVPVKVWILIVDRNNIEGARLEGEITTAIKIYEDAESGITFDTPVITNVNAQIPAGQERDYLYLDPAANSGIMKAGCVNPPSTTPCFYDSTSLNVYLVEFIQGDLGFTSPGPAYGPPPLPNCSFSSIPTCDFFGDMIFLVASRSYDTLAHEFGHTFELDDGGFSTQNLMCEHGRIGEFITKGQSYRANVDEFSYVNTAHIRPVGSPTHRNCPRNSAPSLLNVCPNLDFDP